MTSDADIIKFETGVDSDTSVVSDRSISSDESVTSFNDKNTSTTAGLLLSLRSSPTRPTPPIRNPYKSYVSDKPNKTSEIQVEDSLVRDKVDFEDTTNADFLNTVAMEIAECTDGLGKMKLTREAKMHMHQKKPKTGLIYNRY